MTPEEFEGYARAAVGKGFLTVSATPLTRSSYHAGDDFARLRAARLAKLGRRLRRGGAASFPQHSCMFAKRAPAGVRCRRSTRGERDDPAAVGEPHAHLPQCHAEIPDSRRLDHQSRVRRSRGA